jgi:hypothetical protein
MQGKGQADAPAALLSGKELPTPAVKELERHLSRSGRYGLGGNLLSLPGIE